MAKHKPRVNMVLTADSIRYGYQKSGGSSELLDYGEVKIPPNTLKNGEIINTGQFTDVLTAIIKDKSKRRNWKGRELAFALIDDTVFIGTVNVPGYVSEREAIEYIRVQDGTRINIPFDDSALSVNILKYDTEQQHTELIYYAYPLDKYNRFKAAFEAVGLRPKIADLTSPSIFRYFANSEMHAQGVRHPSEAVLPKHVLVTQWNRSGVYISTFNHSNLVFSRHIKTGLKHPDTASKSAVLSTIHDIAIQIDRIVEFYHTSVMSHEGADSADEPPAKQRRSTRVSHDPLADQINSVVVSGDFPYMHLVKSELEAILGLNIHDFPEHGVSEAVATGRKSRTKAPRKTDTPSTRVVGRHGRSTRMTSFALEQSRNTSAKDAMRSEKAKFIDVYGLSLKTIPPANSGLPIPKIPKVKKK